MARQSSLQAVRAAGVAGGGDSVAGESLTNGAKVLSSVDFELKWISVVSCSDFQRPKFPKT